VSIAEEQVVDYPVAEHGREHLAFLGIVDDETFGRLCTIATGQQIVAKLVKVFGKIAFKLDYIRHLVLVACCVVESNVKVIK
jgi:hypothetical protein